MGSERPSVPRFLFEGLSAWFLGTKAAWRLSHARERFRVSLFNLQDRALLCLASGRGGGRSTTPFVLIRISIWTAASFGALAALLPLALQLLRTLRLGPTLHGLVLELAAPLEGPSVGLAVFGGIAGIGGLLLGLYFTAYSAATAQLFDRMPGPVQRAITVEGAGLRYAERLAVLTSTMLGLGVLVASGHTLPMATYGTSAIVTMVVLGAGLVMARRTANIFDMAQLADLIGTELVRAASRCTMAHPRSHDPSWQNHQRTIAREQLRRLRALVHTVLEQSAIEPSDQLQVAEVLAGTVIRLQSLGAAIHPGSRWHLVKQRRVWPYSVDAFRRHVGLTLGQVAGTEVEPDRAWAERELLELLLQMAAAGIRNGALDRAADVVGILTQAIQQVAEHGRWRLAADAVRRLYARFSELNRQSGIVGQDALLLADAVLSLDMARVVGLLRRVEIGHERLRSDLKAHVWGHPDAELFRSVGRAYTEALWDLHQWARREGRIEGTVGTPFTYFEQRLLAWSVGDVLDAVADWLKEATGRIAQYRILFGGAGDARVEVLACWRARGIGGRLEDLLDHLEASLPAAELDVNIDVPGLRRRLADVRHSAREWLDVMAQSEARTLGPLLALKDVEGEPHWFAETVQHLAGDCVRAMREGRDELLAEIFPQYFTGALAAVWFAGAPTPAPQLSVLMLKWRPFVELLEISGLAYLYAALKSNPTIWEIVCSLWNGWLDKESHTKLDQLENIYALYATPDGIIGEGEVLFGWRRDALVEAARLPRRVRSQRHGFGIDYEFDHPDPEIARLGRESILPELNGREVFARKYLCRRCDSGSRNYVRR